MNGNGQMEVHYINTGFPYTVTESFMNFFEGLTHVPINYGHTLSTHDQVRMAVYNCLVKENETSFSLHKPTKVDAIRASLKLMEDDGHMVQRAIIESPYWSMNMNSYKFGFSAPGSTYYGHYEASDHLPRMEVSRGAWEYPSTLNQEHASADSQFEGDAVMGVHSIPEECSPTHHNNNSSQVPWQDNVDPDTMTYEELLDLGDAVGTQSRGLSHELISLLPTSKYKFKSFFSTKKSRERCVICQMRYKRGDRQIKLPCKHVYHSECISKWLSINKICPICNTEVFGDESKH